MDKLCLVLKTQDVYNIPVAARFTPTQATYRRQRMAKLSDYWLDFIRVMYDFNGALGHHDCAIRVRQLLEHIDALDAENVSLQADRQVLAAVSIDGLGEPRFEDEP